MDRILGQDRAIVQLQASLQNGRVHHAFIFHGQEGVGKCTTARALARVLLCPDRATTLDGTIVACGQCESCRLSDGEGHPDLHVVTKELARFSSDPDTRKRKLIEFPVKVIEERVLQLASRSPVMHHGKVFVIDEAHLLNAEGQNMLLKTLEEPPAGTVIILISQHEEDLLPTIRSRCQRVAFVPLDEKTVRHWVTQHPDAPDDATLTWLVDFAAGSLGRIEMAMLYGLHDWGKTVLEGVKDMTRGIYPTMMGKQMADQINGFAAKWVDQHDNASKDAANKRAAGLMWIVVGQLARDSLQQAVGNANGTDTETAEQALAPWLGVIDAVCEGERELRRNVNLKLVMDHAVSRMHRALRR